MGQEGAILGRPRKDFGRGYRRGEGGPEKGLLEVFDISDENDTGAIGAGDDDDDEEDVGRGVGPEAGDGSDKVAGGGPGVPAAVDLTC